MKSGRLVAYTVLSKFDANRHDAGVLLDRFIGQTDQRGQATDIVYGVIRNLAAIDMVIEKVSSVLIKRISKKLVNILRVGVYELIYAPLTADYAIVNEAVEITGNLTGKKPAGFVNAVLRNVIRAISDRSVSLESADLQKTLPQSATTGCEFKDAIFPDISTDAAGYLSKAFSLPEWLVEGWIDEFGAETTREVCIASNRRPGVFLRANTLKISAEGLADKLAAEGLEFDLVGESGLIKLKSHLPVPEIVGFGDGLFAVQDPTATVPAGQLAPEPGETVLDLCAAPGGKTIQLAELMEDRGVIIATDIDGERLEKVNENCERLGINIVETICFDDLDDVAGRLGGFDAIMLDVPCSNSGVMARRCEVRLRINQEAVKSLAAIQLGLLKRAAAMVKSGGKICYSTCSIMRDENSGVVEKFLKGLVGTAHPTEKGFVLESEHLTLPSVSVLGSNGYDHDGGYAAIIRSI
jgi:16S rRNA (cytosine967-C5)-methyltransferase